jgi:hypothetical protein
MNWIIGSDGPFCFACKKNTFIDKTEDGWPVLVCKGHDISVCAGGRPKPLAGVNPTATAILAWDAAWFLPREVPVSLTMMVGFEKNWDMVQSGDLKVMLEDGLCEYGEAHRGWWDRVKDWLVSQWNC